MADSDFETFRKALVGALTAAGAAPAAPVAPAAAPAAPSTPTPALHEEAPATPPAMQKGDVRKAIENLNNLHGRTHNLFKCKTCRSDLTRTLEDMGLGVKDRGDEIDIYGEGLELPE